MELLRRVLQSMVDFYYGFYGWFIVLTICYGIYYGIERLVKWIGNKISKHRNSKAVHE